MPSGVRVAMAGREGRSDVIGGPAHTSSAPSQTASPHQALPLNNSPPINSPRVERSLSAIVRALAREAARSAFALANHSPSNKELTHDAP